MEEQLSRAGTANLCPIAVITREGRLLMGHRHYTSDKWKEISVWTIPGGRCDAGETIEETLRREVKEETDIADLQINEYLGEVPGAKESDKVVLFGCTTSQEPKLMEPQKFSEWKWIDFDVYKNGEMGVWSPNARELILAYIADL